MAILDLKSILQICPIIVKQAFSHCFHNKIMNKLLILTIKYQLLFRASSPLKQMYGPLGLHFGKFWPLPENSHTRVRVMPKFCQTCQTCGAREGLQFFCPPPMGARGKFGIWCMNAGSGKRRKGLPLGKSTSSSKEKISVLIPSIANKCTPLLLGSLCGSHCTLRKFII